MSIVRVGTTKKYADGWDAIFRNKSKKPSTTKASKSRKRAAARKKR